MTYLQRKKLAFINMVNKVKGFIRTVSGVPPLALTDCVDDESIINYIIEGNCVQNGSPEPDTPIEVESVGDLTNNLFNPDWLEQGTLYDHNGATSNSTTRVRTKFVELTSGTYYIGVNAGILRGLHIYDYDTEAHENYTNWGCAAHKIFTLDKRSKVRFIFNYVTDATMTPEDVLSKQPRLVLSDVEVPYEPYGKYKIPIVCSGKNLFNPDWLKQGTILESTGIPQSSMTRVFTDLISLEAGEYYMRIYPYNNLSLRLRAIHIYNYDTEQWESSTNWNNVQSKHFTISSHCKVRFLFLTPTNDAVTVEDVIGGNPMLVLEGTGTDYEPYVEPTITNIYLDEPLYKIGDHADYIDFEKQKVIRKIYKKILTGTESWTKPTPSVYAISRGYVKPAYNYETRINVLCNHLTAESSNYEIGCGVTSNNLIINYDNGIMGISTWKQLLKDLYKANTPIIIYYVRAEYEETAITVPELPTLKDTTIYVVDTTVQPSNIRATYYSTVKE